MGTAVKTLTGVEIFAVGRWNGLKFTSDDLDTIVRSFDGLGLAGRVPLKLGHDGPDSRTDPLSQLAMGWVTKVYRSGNKLLADLEVPGPVQSLIEQGFLKFVSVELLQNVQASTRVIPWVLDAVALLGSDQPAVGILKDLQALANANELTVATMASKTMTFEAAATFARADYSPLSPETKHMSDDNKGAMTLQELTDKLLAQGAQINDLVTENRQLKTERAEFQQIKTRFTALQDEVKTKEVTRHRAEIKAVIEAAVKAEDILPAARERFNKVYRVEDDETVMAISIEDAKEFVRENKNPLKKEPKKPATFTLDKPTDDVPAGTPPDQAIRLKALAFARLQNIHEPTADQLVKFTKQVMAAEPELARAWQFQLDNRAA